MVSRFSYVYGAGRLPVIAKVLGVDVPYFFNGANGAPTPTKRDAGHPASSSQQIIESVLSSPLGMRLNKAFAQLDDKKKRHRLVELVEQIVAAQ